MIPDITEVNLPSYVTLSEATVTITDMGERTIAASIKIPATITPDFVGTDGNDWALSFKGEKFIMPLRKPQGSKSVDSAYFVYDLTFYSEVVNDLKRYYFVELASIGSGTAIADKYNASLNLTLSAFVTELDNVLQYYFGDKIRATLAEGVESDPVLIEINYSYIWEVLTKAFEAYNARFSISLSQGVYTIAFGETPEDITHVFDYGYENGLLKIERTVQNPEIKNILLGRGGSKNLPMYYFKTNPHEGEDTDEGSFKSDYDSCPELANIYFDAIRDAAFRDYIIGWNYTHHGGPSWANHPYRTGSPTQAYEAGRTDTRFNPIEYVKDEVSIQKYGPLWGALENNEEIYPTIQGVTRGDLGRVDEAIDIEQVSSDDVEEGVKAASEEVSVQEKTVTEVVNHLSAKTVIIEGFEFTVPEGKTGNFNFSIARNVIFRPAGYDYARERSGLNFDMSKLEVTSAILQAVDSNGQVHSSEGLAAGTYRYVATISVYNRHDGDAFDGQFTIGVQGLKITYTEAIAEGWKGTFNIWVKNIWGTQKNTGETDDEYVQRVWLPILGDREGNEARVVFSDGNLSGHSDWEFPIVGPSVFDGVHFDQSKTRGNIRSEWRLTLQRSDAEMDTIKKLVPYVGFNATAGDHFFFIGIDMNQWYTIWAENKLHDVKEAELGKLSEINPTWSIQFDKLRIQEERTIEGNTVEKLYDLFGTGKRIKIQNAQLTGTDILLIYVKTLTYRWQDGSQIPEVEITLDDKVDAVESTVEVMKTSIGNLERQIISLNQLERQIEQVCSNIFLKKTGESQKSYSPTTFASSVTSDNFKQGNIGGEGWGVYRDAAGNLIMEADKVIVRNQLLANELVINQVSAMGGAQVISAAAIVCSQVIETDDGYKCFFDQKQGQVGNLFLVGDVAYCQCWTENNTEEKYYRRKVTEVGIDYIVLSKTIKNGEGVPQVGDNIIQYGNYTNAARQYVIVTDVIGGGRQRMLSGLTAVDSAGQEYYFAGYDTALQTPRWFVGNDQYYAEFKNGVLNIRGNIYIGSSDKTLEDLSYLADSLGDDTDGLLLANQIALYNGNNIQGGISGVIDSAKGLQSIAAWFGGPKVDKQTTPTPQSYATSLFRFDGSGYVGNGSIRWGTNGSVYLEAGSINIGGNATISTLAKLLLWFKEDSNGDIYLDMKDETHPRNFYCFGGITAGGKGTGGGGGGGSYNDLTDQPQINGITLSGNKTAAQLGLVAAVTGKGLSTNDFTDEEKIKLRYLENNVFVGDGNTTFSEFWGAINGGLAVIKNSDDGETYILTNTDAGEGGGLLFTRVTDRYIYWDLMYEDAPEESGEIGIQEELVSGTNIKTINGQSVLGSGNISVGGVSLPECGLMTNGIDLYVTVPHGTVLPSVTVEIARNIVSRSGNYYGHVSHKGWLSLTASGRNHPLVTFNQLMLRGVPEENYSDGKDAYPVLAAGKRNGRDNDPTDIPFNNLYQLAKTFATTDRGDTTRGNGIRHGARRVKKAKWGIRLKSGSTYITGWMPFHIVYVGGSELVSLTK